MERFTSRSRLRVYGIGAALVLFLVTLAIALSPDAITSYDAQTLAVIGSWRSASLIAMAFAFTVLGSPQGVIILLAAIVLFLVVRKLPGKTGLMVSVIGAVTTAYLLKPLIERVRPDRFSVYIDPSYSFPSQHATAAMALYGFLIFLGLHRFERRWIRIAWATCGALLILAIGASRLVLGVHYPSDILAGYLLGMVWIAIGAAVHERRLRRARLAAPHD